MRNLLIAFTAACVMLLTVFYAGVGGREEFPSGASGDVGVKEHTGRSIPLDAVFYDEQGHELALGQLFGKPVVLSLIYYTCSGICPLLLSAIADVTSKLQFAPGKDYALITISFDPEDTPGSARELKKNYMKPVGGAFPAEAWSFLTGTRENIAKILDAVGFTVKKDDIQGFSHPAALVVLSADGKIIRYVYTEGDGYFASRSSVAFQPFDLSLAIGDAAKGKTGLSVSRALAYCFSRPSKGQEAFFNILKISGVIIVFLVLSFFVYLVASGRKQRIRKGP